MFKLSDSYSFKDLKDEKRKAAKNRQNNRNHKRARARKREWKESHTIEEPRNAMDVVKAVSAKRKAGRK